MDLNLIFLKLRKYCAYKGPNCLKLFYMEVISKCEMGVMKNSDCCDIMKICLLVVLFVRQC